MSGQAPSARLFVAVDPPEPVALELAAWARLAARQTGTGGRSGQQSLRLLDPELLHVTVCFLGNRALDEIPALADEMAACECPSVRLSVGAPLWLPPRHPRALAVEMHDQEGALARIHADVLTRLERSEQEPHGKTPARSDRARPRGFHPHITVARMRPEAGRRSGERALPPTPALSFAPAELVLYRSWLAPEGASYEALAACPIG